MYFYKSTAAKYVDREQQREHLLLITIAIHSFVVPNTNSVPQITR